MAPGGMKHLLTSLGILAAAAAAAPATSSARPAALPKGSEAVHLDPADFSTRITNPYWPMRPGSRWVSRETDPEGTRQRSVVTVTRRTKRIANGVTARVVHDVVSQRGRLVEVTDDFYAQDRGGNIWYLGEATTEYVHGRPGSTEGSFEAGVAGGQPGVIMPAHPRPGLRYREEYLKGHAEDRARVVSVSEQAEVPFGHFRHVLMTRNVNPLEPKVVEFKFYARGVGPVLAVSVSGESDREELVRYHRG